MIKTDEWYGKKIRFVEKDDEWFVVVDDVCKALDLWSGKCIAEDILDPELVEMIKVDDSYEYCTNELGLYQIIFKSNNIEARKFKRWSSTVLQRLRKQVGLEPFESMHMLSPEIQEDIDHILDTLFYDPETGKLMQSVTVQGGDVEQVVFEQ